MGTWKMNHTWIKSRINHLLYLAYPDLCLVCGAALNDTERLVCHECLYRLPKPDFDNPTDNEAARLFFGKLPVEKVACGLKYLKESPVQDLMEALKYRGRKDIGPVLGSFTAAPLLRTGFFNGIDLLVPVPLHPAKQKRRGYNQSEWLAKGVAQTTGLPIDTTSLKRLADNKTQTKKGLFERWQNVETLFDLADPLPFEGKHILLIDDVLTSGSTLEACGKAVLKAKNARISFFTLARA